MSADLLLTGGLVVDGSGAPARRADVAVSGATISAVGDLGGLRAATVRDVTGRLVCPGFIDIHTHSDLTLLSNPLAYSKIRQGVTTEVVGNCGLGVTPLPPGGDVDAVRAAVGYLDVDPTVRWDWTDQAGYLDALRQARTSVNVASLVAHLPLRAGVVGFGDRAPSGTELDRMAGLLAEGLAAGAYGLSTGLAYAPLCYAADDELTELARVVAAHDALFAWHLRDYGDALLDSAAQAIRIAEATGARTQISHLVSVGRRNWGTVARVLDLVDGANARGADVAVDVYPYTAGNCPLSQLLPYWAQEGGDAAMRARLAEPAARANVIAEWADRVLSWSEVTISATPAATDPRVGHTVAALAEAAGADGDEYALDLLAEWGNAVGIVAGGRSEDDLRAVLHHRAAVIGSDGQALDPAGPTGRGSPHPRSYGTYPRLLARYAELVDTGAAKLSVERAVRMSTSAVAARLGITDRGRIAPGLAADLVVIDPTVVSDRASFTDPQRFPDGITMVIVNGVTTVADNAHISARNGLILRH